MKQAKQERSHEDMQLESRIELQIATQVTARISYVINNATSMQIATQIAGKALQGANDTIANPTQIAKQVADETWQITS
jgi:hypothetical protein